MDNPSRAEANARATFKRWVREQFPDVAEQLDKAGDEEDPIIQDILLGKAKKAVGDLAVEQAQKHVQRDIKEAMDAVDWPVITPWLAHKGHGKDGGTRYESEAVLQLLHRNGDVSFACAKEGCDYASDNPRGVAVHYGKTHTAKGEVPPASQDNGLTVDPEYTEPILQRDYRPTDRLIAALAAVLAKLNGHGTDQEKAEEILRWFHERPALEPTTRPDVPLTDADILFRIRRLVSPGVQEALQSAQTDLEAVKIERDLALAQLAKVSRDLEGIKDLLGEVGR
jgi:hypothetical protein